MWPTGVSSRTAISDSSTAPFERSLSTRFASWERHERLTMSRMAAVSSGRSSRISSIFPYCPRTLASRKRTCDFVGEGCRPSVMSIHSAPDSGAVRSRVAMRLFLGDAAVRGATRCSSCFGLAGLNRSVDTGGVRVARHSLLGFLRGLLGAFFGRLARVLGGVSGVLAGVLRRLAGLLGLFRCSRLLCRRYVLHAGTE